MYDRENLEQDTFGGPYEKGKEPQFAKLKQQYRNKMFNAYVLFYERDQFLDTSDFSFDEPEQLIKKYDSFKINKILQ